MLFLQVLFNIVESLTLTITEAHNALDLGSLVTTEQVVNALLVGIIVVGWQLLGKHTTVLCLLL